MINHKFIQKNRISIIIFLVTLFIYDFASHINSNNLILVAFIIGYYTGIRYLKFTADITWAILFTISILTAVALATGHNFAIEKLSIWMYLFLIIYFYQALIRNRNSK